MNIIEWINKILVYIGVPLATLFYFGFRISDDQKKEKEVLAAIEYQKIKSKLIALDRMLETKDSEDLAEISKDIHLNRSGNYELRAQIVELLIKQCLNQSSEGNCSSALFEANLLIKDFPNKETAYRYRAEILFHLGDSIAANKDIEYLNNLK